MNVFSVYPQFFRTLYGHTSRIWFQDLEQVKSYRSFDAPFLYSKIEKLSNYKRAGNRLDRNLEQVRRQTLKVRDLGKVLRVEIVNYLFRLEVGSDRSVFAYSNQNGAKLGVLYAKYLPLRLLLVMSACVETNTLCTYTPTHSAITHSEGNPSLFT